MQVDSKRRNARQEKIEDVPVVEDNMRGGTGLRTYTVFLVIVFRYNKTCG
jgi:hypothetical protein